MPQNGLSLHPGWVKWAIQLIDSRGDGDLFPPLPEIGAIGEYPGQFIQSVTSASIGQLKPQPARNFIVPKGELSYRSATQLHPRDSIVLTALIAEYGQLVEERRLPADIVYSHRFDPHSGGGLYGVGTKWHEFWDSASERARSYSYILYCDIADFYNQISHHAVENQLDQSGFPGQVTQWLLDLFGSATVRVSRGIPIGPMGTHLVAEATLIPVDNSLLNSGIEFMRFADDILMFCHTRRDVRRAMFTLARTLDQQQKLTLQQQKTRVFNAEEFEKHCAWMTGARSANQYEEKVFAVIDRYVHGDPYGMLSWGAVSEDDWNELSEEVFDAAILSYLGDADRDGGYKRIDYERLSWFFRRVAQIGHPGAVPVVLSQMDRLDPCLPAICSYLSSIEEMPVEDWHQLGTRLLAILDGTYLGDVEFLRLSILSLFGRNSGVNHFPELARRFGNSNPHERREIILAAKANGAVDWLRERKQEVDSMDPWQRLAFLYSAADLPNRERPFVVKRRPGDDEFTKWLVEYARGSL